MSTPNYGFHKPPKGTRGWDIPWNDNFDLIESIYVDHSSRLSQIESNPKPATAAAPLIRQAVLTGSTATDGAANFLEAVQLKALIPDMISDTSPSGIVRAGSQLSSNYPARNAFNASGNYSGASTNYTMWISNNTQADWISYEFEAPQAAIGYSIQVPSTARLGSALTAAPKSWNLEGSNDGVSWSVLDTRIDQVNWINDETRKFTVAHPGSYKIYRLNILSNNGAAYIAVERLQLYNPEGSAHYRSVSLKAADTPVTLSFAGGTVNAMPKDFIEKISEDVDSAWSNLELGKTNYLYIERNPITGELTYGSTVIQPYYGPAPDILTYKEYPAIGNIQQRGADFDPWPRYVSTTVPISSSFTHSQIFRAEWVGEHYWEDAQSNNNVYGNARMRMFINGYGSIDVTKFYSSQAEFTYEAVALEINPDWLNLNGDNEVGYYFSITSGYTEHTLTRNLKIRLYTKPEFTEGAHWFDTNNMKMYVGSSEGWLEKQRIFVGEATFDSIGLSSLNCYALLGRYDSGWFPVTTNTVYSRVHNIGVPSPKIIAFLGDKVDRSGPVLDMLSNTSYNASSNAFYGGVIHDNNAIKIDLAATTHPYNEYNVGPAQTTAMWRIILERGF